MKITHFLFYSFVSFPLLYLFFPFLSLLRELGINPKLARNRDHHAYEGIEDLFLIHLIFDFSWILSGLRFSVTDNNNLGMKIKIQHIITSDQGIATLSKTATFRNYCSLLIKYPWSTHTFNYNPSLNLNH